MKLKWRYHRKVAFADRYKSGTRRIYRIQLIVSRIRICSSSRDCRIEKLCDRPAFIRSYCFSGSMHLDCGKNDIKTNPVAHHNDRHKDEGENAFSKRPGCRKFYSDQDLMLLNQGCSNAKERFILHY